MNKVLQSAGLIGLVALQAVGAGWWWEWFRHNPSSGLSGGGVVGKTLLIALVLGVWGWLWSVRGERMFGWSGRTVWRRDVLAGVPLMLLPALIPLAPWLAELVKPFPMKLTAFVWMPWWTKGQVLAPKAYAMLMAGGVLMMGALITKAALLLREILRVPVERVTSGRLFLAGALLYLAILSWPACVSAPQSGENSILLVSQAIAFDNTWNIDQVLLRANFFQFHPLQEIYFVGFSDSLGRLFLTVAPGMPLLFMAGFLPQGRWLTSVLVLLFAAGVAAQLYGLCRDHNFSDRANRLTWLALLVNSPLLLYGYQMYEVTTGAFFIAWGLRLTFQIKNSLSKNNLGRAAGVGLAVGLLWLGSIRLALAATIILVYFIYVLLRRGALRDIGVAVLTMAIPWIGALMFYFTVYWFFLDHMPYRFNFPWNLRFWSNAMAIVADRTVGIAWNAPLWLFGLAGTWSLLKSRYRDLGMMVLSLVFTACLFAMVFPNPHAEGSSLHRFLALVLPFLGIGLAVWIDRVPKQSLGFRLAALSGIWGMAVAGIQVVFPFLSQEAVRMKLGQMLKPLGWIYECLPSFSGAIGIVDVVVGMAVLAGAGFAVYRLVGYLRPPADQTI